MSNPLLTSFDRQLAAMHDRLRTEWRWPSPEAGFAHHIFHASDIVPPPNCSADIAGIAIARLDQAPLLASSGYLLSPDSSQAVMSAWTAGLQRLAARKPFTVDRQSFAYRPYEICGICLGAARCQAVPQQAATFLQSIARQMCDDQSATAWCRLLAAYAGLIIGAPWPASVIPHIHGCDLSELSLLRWLRSQPTVASHLHMDDSATQQLTQAILERALIDISSSMDIGQLALAKTSLQAVVREAIGSSVAESWQLHGSPRAAMQVVENICRRFPLLAKQMTHRHDGRGTLEIRDEYDVQDLLHSVLVMHFDDVRPEEWTPSYAGTSTRMDFLLKAERLVIEVKMTRKGLDQKKVLEELAVDKMRYRSHPDCGALICFVYDPLGICRNPVALERDASEDTGGIRITVIVAPHGV